MREMGWVGDGMGWAGLERKGGRWAWDELIGGMERRGLVDMDIISKEACHRI